MPDIRKQFRSLIPALILALMLSPLALSEKALALPTLPITSEGNSLHHSGNGYYVFGSNQGTHDQDGSSPWLSPGSYGNEHSEDGWDDYDDEDGWDDWDDCGEGHEGDGDYGDDCDDNGGYGNDYDGHDGDDGNTSPVPEPTTAILMSLGLAGIVFLKSRLG